MIVKEQRVINGQTMNYVYSDIGAMLRCGKIRYKDAADPLDVDRAYFEDGISSEPEPEQEM